MGSIKTHSSRNIMFLSICKGMFLGSAFTFLIYLSISFLGEGTEPLLQTLKKTGFSLMIVMGGFCAAMNSAIYLFNSDADKIIRKYSLGSFGISAFCSVLFLISTGELTNNPWDFLILIFLLMTLALGCLNFFFAGLCHLTLKATKTNTFM